MKGFLLATDFRHNIGYRPLALYPAISKMGDFLFIFLFIVGKYETSTNEGSINKSYNYLTEAQGC
jgi:hypothetical protein